MVATSKHWTTPPETRGFHYHITDFAVRKFRERSDCPSMTDSEVAMEIDRRVFEHFGAAQSIVISRTPAETTHIVNIALRPGVVGVAVLQTIRPNAYPTPQLCGGPAGVGLGVVAILDSAHAAENFAKGFWKVAFRQFEGPLTKMLREQGELTDTPSLPLAPTPVAPALSELPQEGTSMDASLSKRRSYSNMLEHAALVGPQPSVIRHVTIGKPTSSGGRGRRTFTEDFQRAAVKEFIKSKETATDWAKANDLNQSVLCKWVIKYTGRPVPKRRVKYTGRPVPKRRAAAAVRSTSAPVVNGKHGTTAAIRNVLSDGVARSVRQICDESGCDHRSVGITICDMIKRPDHKDIKRVDKGIYQMIGKSASKSAQKLPSKKLPSKKAAPIPALRVRTGDGDEVERLTVALAHEKQLASELLAAQKTLKTVEARYAAAREITTRCLERVQALRS